MNAVPSSLMLVCLVTNLFKQRFICVFYNSVWTRCPQVKLRWTMPKSHHQRELKWRQVSRILYTNLSSLRTSFPFGGYRKKYTHKWHARRACSRARTYWNIQPKMRKFSGRPRYLYHKVLIWEAVLERLPFGRKLIKCNFEATIGVVPCRHWTSVFVCSEKRSTYSEYRDYTILWVVAYRRLKQWKIIKLFPQFTVERWSFTRGFNDMTLSETMLACLVGGSLLHSRF